MFTTSTFFFALMIAVGLGGLALADDLERGERATRDEIAKAEMWLRRGR